MKKAIIVIAHQKPEQLNLFLEQLLHDQDTYVFLHINKLCEDILPSIKRQERLVITENRFVIHWGSDEILQAILSLFTEILKSAIAFEYVLICTGQDLLIKSDLDRFLSKHKNQVFVDCDNRETQYMDLYERARLLYRWPEVYRRKYDNRYHPFRILRSIHFRTLLKQPPFGKKIVDYDVTQMTFYKDYWQCGLPIEVVEYILKFISDNPGYMDIYKGAYIPEEGFITTIVMNSKYKSRIVFHGNISESITLRGDERNDHPIIFTMKDLERLDNSDCYFARKFDIDVDREIIQYLVERVKGKL